MIFLASRFIGKPILSIRAGHPIGSVTGVLINPHKLKVDAFWVQVGAITDNKILLSQDIREIGIKGVVINDLHDIADADNMPRLEELIKIAYEIPGKKVLERSHRIGTAVDFGFNDKDMSVVSILVKPKLAGRLRNAQKTIHRSQIKSIDDSSIHVSTAPKKERAAIRRKRTADKPKVALAANFSTYSKAKTHPPL